MLKTGIASAKENGRAGEFESRWRRAVAMYYNLQCKNWVDLGEFWQKNVNFAAGEKIIDCVKSYIQYNSLLLNSTRAL